MAPEFEGALPPQWRFLFQIVTLPVAWIPPAQATILGFIWDYSSSTEATLKFLLFLLPALHVIAAMSCTMTAVYTLPFRGGRKQFITVVLSTWWDSGRAVGMYWAGMLRAMFLTAGYAWGFIRILSAGLYLAIVEIITLPLSLLKQVKKRTLRPGIPWIAVTLTIVWCIIEGGIFSFTLYPTASDIAKDLMGGGSQPYLQPVLFVLLVLLIAGFVFIRRRKIRAQGSSSGSTGRPTPRSSNSSGPNTKRARRTSGRRIRVSRSSMPRSGRPIRRCSKSCTASMKSAWVNLRRIRKTRAQRSQKQR